MKSLLPRTWILFAVLTLAACSKNTEDLTDPVPEPPVVVPPTPVTDNDAILLGNPTNAVTSTGYPENYLKDNLYYKLAYSRSKGTPVWVAWHLQREDIGSTSRQDDFRPDDKLPVDWYHVDNASYSNSGFDRGHNCPSADRTTTTIGNSSTFLMTNIIPQAPLMNQGPWEGLEDFVRNNLVAGNNEAYIFMGNYGQGGTGSNGVANTINAGRVNVPAYIWKVVVVMPKGNGDLARIDAGTTVLAVNMPNNNQLYSTNTAGKNAWRNYVVTVSDLELQANAAGIPLNLFKEIPENVRGVLKEKLYN